MGSSRHWKTITPRDTGRSPAPAPPRSWSIVQRFTFSFYSAATATAARSVMQRTQAEVFRGDQSRHESGCTTGDSAGECCCYKSANFHRSLIWHQKCCHSQKNVIKMYIIKKSYCHHVRHLFTTPSLHQGKNVWFASNNKLSRIADDCKLERDSFTRI